MFRPLFIFAVAISSMAHAYPTFFAEGYRTCLSCHVSMQGSGLLTDYGKGIGASIALFPKDLALGEPVAPPAFSVNVGAQVRAMAVFSDPIAVFPMQADALASLSLGGGQRVDGTLGYHSDRSRGTRPFKDYFVLRKAIYAYRYNKDREIAVGRDFLPSGLLLDDHTLWIRSRNRRGVTDFPTQVRWDVAGAKTDSSVFAYTPSFQEATNNRESGAGARVEHELSKKFTLGALAQEGVTSSLARTEVAAFSRSLIGDVGLLAELDYTFRKERTGTRDSFSQIVSYVRPYFEPIEGVEAGIGLETLKVTNPYPETAFRGGPTLNLRFNQYFTLIADYKIEIRSGSTISTFSTQVFGHF